MAAKEKDPELGGLLDRPAEMDNQQESYEKKFKEMQKYIPFLEMMIQKLERSSDKSREAQLLKMKSLHSILSNTKKKLKIETLKRCEDVLQKLYEKVEKGSASQQKTANSNTADVKKTNVTVKSTKSNNLIGNEPKDATNDQHVTSSTDDSPVANIMKSLKMTTVRSNSKNVSSTTLSPAHSSEDSRDEVPSTTCNISIESNNMKVRNKALDNLEQSRERLKKLLGQNFFPSEGKAGSGFDTSADWKFQREAPWKKQSDIHSHPRDSSDKYHSDPHLREDTRKGNNLTLPFKDHRVQQYSDRWSNLNEERARTSSGKYDETYMCWTDYKPSTSRPSYHAEGDRYINIGPNFGLNTNMPMLSPTSVSTNFGPNGNKLMLSPTSVGPHANKPMHSPTSVGPAFGLNNNKSMLGPTSVSPIQHSPTNSSAPQSFGTNSSSPIKRQTSQNIPPLYNVLQHPPIAGSKPLSDADIEELMEDTSKSKPDKDTMKKEESALKSLRAKLEQEIQQVHKVGVSKGGALRNLVQKDEKLKSPTRGRLDLIKPNTEMRKDKSPTGTGVCSDKQKTSPVDKNTENIESEGQKGELHNVDSRDKKPTDPRKRIPYSPRGEEECRSVNWDITKSPNLNSLDKRESNFKTLSDTKHNGSNSNTEASQDKSHEKANKDGSSILSSLSKEELQKIVEENLRNLPSLPPNTKEILETVSMNSPTVGMKPAWHSSPEMVSPLSPKEYNHGLPRNPTTFNSNFANARPALLPTPELPHDPRIHARNQTHDPRLGLNDSQVQGIVSHSVINDPRLNSSRHQSQENYRFSSHDQFTRRPYNLSSQTSFFSNHSSQPWIGTPCYGVLSHSSQRHLDEGFIHPNDSFSHRTTQGFQGHTSSQHEIAQFQGQIHPTHDSFSTGQQLSWQSQHSFRGGLPGSFHPSQPGQHHMERTLGLTKGPVDPRLCGSSSIGDPRLTNSSPMSSHVAGHRPTMPNTGSMQNTNSTSNNPQIRGSGTGSLARPSNTEGRLGSTFSERDPRRKSTEESEKLDTANRGSRDSRNVKISRDSKGSKEKRKNSSSSWVANSGRAADRRNSRDRRKDSDPRKYETNNDNKEAKKGKETELVSPLNSLYGVTIIPKTGKGYGFQKFRIPKIKRPSPPPSPPASSKASNLESSLESKLESQSDIVPEDQHTKEVSKTKSDDDLSDSKAAVYELDGDKNSEPRSKESVTQEWIEGLIRKSFESGEGKKFMEKAKLLEKLGESLKGKKLKKIKQILESDSESESDENVSESFKKKESKSGDKDTLNDDIGIPIEYNKKSKSRRIIESDDEHSTDSEPLAVKLQKRENAFESENTSDKVKKKFKIVSKSYEGQETKNRSDNENTVIEEQMEPVKKYSKRRSALELLQEDIREMFICEGVVTATGHRMCRLLKETRPGMTVDEITKSATKDIDDTSFVAEDSDGSSILVKKHDKNQSKDMDSGKKGKEGKQGKKQKAKVKLKDESVENGSEKIIESVFETEEQLSNVKIKKDDNALDETGDSSSSPVTKPRKKYEKSKWKGYVIEESEVSQDETEKEEFEFESSASFSNTNHSRKIKSGVSDSGDEYEGKEHGRRTRFPRIILEKADISKLNIVSSKSKAKYFEDSSSDESVERSSSSPMNSSKARQLQKSRRGRQSSVFRGRGRGSAAKKGQKKRSKSEKGEVSTDAENMISGQSSVANSMSQITDWASPYIVSGFTFRRKYTRKGSKLLGKKIDEIIKRLKKI